MKVNMRTSSSRSSNIKATASSQSAGSKRAAKVKCKRVKMEMERVVAANERSSSSSHSQARADSNPTQFSYDYDDGSGSADAAMVASPELRVHLHAPQCQASVFRCQYCSANVKYYVQSHNQDSVSMSSSVQLVSNSDETTTRAITTTIQTQVASTQQKAEANTTHRSSDVNITHQVQIQPFNDDELMYLAGIFEKDSPSRDDDLRSILSLDQESTVEDSMLAD